MKNKIEINDLNQLTSIIEETHKYFVSQVQKQVNIALTLRNWLIGYYIVEYEQKGTDRAAYGKGLIKNLSLQLKQRNLKGFSEIALRMNRSFYFAYPQIQQTLSVEFKLHDNKLIIIQQTPSVESKISEQILSDKNETPITNPVLLLNRLSFSHFIELLKADNLLMRVFYEVESIKNHWTVRELQRAMNSMLFERTGISTKKQTLINKNIGNSNAVAKDIFRNPLMLEFLGLEEKTEYNYYKENEMHDGDNPPIGIILCASKNENLVKYATSGLSQQVFVSKYLVNLPKEEEFKKIIREEQEKY